MSKKKENIETTVLNVNEPEVNENTDIVNVEPASPEIKPDEEKDIDTENVDIQDNESTESEDEPGNKPEQPTKPDEEKKKEYKLNIKVAFTDKYTGEKYKVGDVITVSKERFEELINDSRKLVSKNK